MITSSKPSPLTSPALETELPNPPWNWLPSALQAGPFTNCAANTGVEIPAIDTPTANRKNFIDHLASSSQLAKLEASKGGGMLPPAWNRHPARTGPGERLP